MNPVVLHIVRPYAGEDEYLAAEAWTIEARAMLLVDQPNLAPDTAVVFDLALADGVKIIRAEGRVLGYLSPSEDRLGGLRVRFRRFGAQTKAFIDRAVQARERNLAVGPSSRPPPAREPAVHELAAEAPTGPAATFAARAAGDPLERSGIHSRPTGPVAAPPNRDELLDRLRQRAGALAASSTADSERSAKRN
jgi:hypothetical protein